LRAPNGTQELAIIAYDHETIPPEGRKPTTGLILSFEVADAAAEAQRFAARGIKLAQPLRDEVFGQRHFIASDPNGVLLDVITPIPPDPTWLAAQGNP
ncbi:MAG TPA: VOC family protein, partial [Devosia sp.]|nr:VOC family protein [Devosia sp.]